ncbi:dihydroorotate dehydrogenase 2 [Companilactobacillus mindensis DSM 14500]|jgi:dihydroorotate dehydrogenase, subfamily 2|uniref:Dihydroorotate dehydrogenase (quinone) n=1 Tax=Companilactobacillus mindensis DSM 14500 TaxID=1423770 RepID=A0A0R1QTB7_9LACO|nr:quinone-dependent dihydroorotate dehydrogenase [Companilactobacillus mindensis]KRL45477.1 dihydroorotate dehydrogenase 2 [Companilactobacillus mindensis DSM 14500]GEO77817.1 dihydroorotate dehydrogenase (quinone) [Companilactobacillus mindensis]
MKLYKLVRPAIFKMDPEVDHHIVATGLKMFNKTPEVLRTMFQTKKRANLKVTVKGVTFDSPIGIAAGFDKKAEFYNSLGALGAGFVEIGSITKHDQPGNKKKRIFRLPEDNAIINRMGLNNLGVEETRKHLANTPKHVKIGISVAPGHGLSSDEMVAEMVDDIKEIHAFGDYIALNQSCPNQKGVTALQEVTVARKLLQKIHNLHIKEPVFCKFGNDITTEQLIELIKETDGLMDGIILTNTASNPSEVHDHLQSVHRNEGGGLSGKPIFKKSLSLTRSIHAQYPDLPIMFSGGVFTPEDAKAALEAGASLVQVYTGFIYNGPTLMNDINTYLSKENVIDKVANNYTETVVKAPVRDEKDIKVDEIESTEKVELDANSGASFHEEA